MQKKSFCVLIIYCTLLIPSYRTAIPTKLDLLVFIPDIFPLHTLQ